MGNIVELEGISKVYGENVIFSDVDFKLAEGESVSITSPSGMGKSTLLSIIGLLLTPTEGKLVVQGEDMTQANDEERSALRRNTFGFIFQHTQLIGSLRAAENVAVPTRFMRDSQGYDEKARELLEGFGLGDRLDHYPYQLSVGQKRRIAAARALLLDPQVIIADEPTNDLDSVSARIMAEHLFERVEQGKSLILVTHDMELADRCERRLNLENGSLVEIR